MEKLPEDEEVASCLAEFVAMDGATYLEEVRSHPSPKELEEYLDRSPGERTYLKKQTSIRYVHHVKKRSVR